MFVLMLILKWCISHVSKLRLGIQFCCIILNGFLFANAYSYFVLSGRQWTRRHWTVHSLLDGPQFPVSLFNIADELVYRFKGFNMPNTYKKKTERTFNPESMKLAVQEILSNNASIRKTSLRYQVTKSRLALYVKRAKEVGLDQMQLTAQTSIKVKFNLA